MKLTELLSAIAATLMQDQFEDRDIGGVYTSDLLSDAIAHAPADGLLVTIQAHKNTVAVGSLKDLVGIIICNDRPIPADMLSAARDEGVAIAVTSLDQFAVSGRLYPFFSGQ